MYNLELKDCSLFDGLLLVTSLSRKKYIIDDSANYTKLGELTLTGDSPEEIVAKLSNMFKYKIVRQNDNYFSILPRKK